jgi:hypothetical protein
MEIKINIEKKHLYILSLLVILIGGMLFVKGASSNFGHSASDVYVNVNGVEKSLQELVDDNSMGDVFVGNCWAPKGGNCKCNLDEKFMMLIGNSAGSSGHCTVKNQNSTDVYGECDPQTTGGSLFSCFK